MAAESSSLIDASSATTDVTEAEQTLSDLWDHPVLSVSGDTFSLRRRTHGDNRLQLTALELSGQTHLAIEVNRFVGVAELVDGSLRATSNDEIVDVGAPFLLRPGVAEAWTSDLHAELLTFDLDALSRFAGTDAAASLRFDHRGAVSPALQRSWELTVAHVSGVLRDAELRANDLIRQAAVDAAYAAALAAFAIDVEVADAPVVPRAVARAQEFIAAHIASPLSIGDIAEASGLSVRGLQSAFQRTLGVTPAGYVRTARLAGARSDLRASSAEHDTVAAIARRWGFAHLPRFAQHYRAEFGEQPSETLRR